MRNALSPGNPVADDWRGSRGSGVAPAIAVDFPWRTPSIGRRWRRDHVYSPGERRSLPHLPRRRRAVGFRSRPEIESQFGVLPNSSQLAAKGTEAERIRETAAANLAGVDNAFSRPRLRPLVQKHDFGAVDNVGLNAGNIYKFGDFRYPDHVVVRRSSNLDDVMIFVVGDAIRTESGSDAIQTVHIAFPLVGNPMNFAGDEEIGS